MLRVRLTVTLKDGRQLSGVYWPEGARLRQEFAMTMPMYAESDIEDAD